MILSIVSTTGIIMTLIFLFYQTQQTNKQIYYLKESFEEQSNALIYPKEIRVGYKLHRDGREENSEFIFDKYDTDHIKYNVFNENIRIPVENIGKDFAFDVEFVQNFSRYKKHSNCKKDFSFLKSKATLKPGEMLDILAYNCYAYDKSLPFKIEKAIDWNLYDEIYNLDKNIDCEVSEKFRSIKNMEDINSLLSDPNHFEQIESMITEYKHVLESHAKAKTLNIDKFIFDYNEFKNDTKLNIMSFFSSEFFLKIQSHTYLHLIVNNMVYNCITVFDSELEISYKNKVNNHFKAKFNLENKISGVYLKKDFFEFEIIISPKKVFYKKDDKDIFE